MLARTTSAVAGKTETDSRAYTPARVAYSPSSSPAFLPRYAMHKRGLCCRPVSVCLSVRPSVRPSVMLLHCIHTAEDIVKILSRPGNPIILVFLTPAPIPNSKRNPFSGGAKYTGVGKICDFRLKSPCISEMVRDRPIVATER